MTEAIIILMNMRGGCATVGKTVHTLFRVNNNRRPSKSFDEARGVIRETNQSASGGE